MHIGRAFTANLTSFEIGARNQIPEGTAVPRVGGLAELQPLDQDGDGAFDHLRANFDLVSPGGDCTWSGSIGWQGEDGSGGAQSTYSSAKTNRGVNHLSMELDVTSSFSLRDHPRFRFFIGHIKCGSNPGITLSEMQEAGLAAPLFEQTFAIQVDRFAKMGEFKRPPSAAPSKPAVAIEMVRSGGPFPAGILQTTTKHASTLRIRVASRRCANGRVSSGRKA